MYRKNVAGQHVTFELKSTTDGSPVTGATVSVRRCIDGTFAAATGTVTEDGSTGWYKFALSQADTNGNHIGLRFSATGALVVGMTLVTMAGDPTDAVRMGLTALPNANAEASGGLPTLSAAQGSNGTIQANVHRWLTGTPSALQSGRVDAYMGAVAAGVIAAASFAAAALDAVWSTATRRLTDGTNIVLAKGTGITGFNDLSAAAVNAEVDTALADYDPPTRAELTSDVNALAAYVDNEVALILEDTGTTIPASIAALDGKIDTIDNNVDLVLEDTGSTIPTLIDALPTAAENADAVWDEAIADHAGAGSTGEALDDAGAAGTPPTVEEIRAEMDANSTKLDVAVGTRLATSGYTAPPTAVQNADALLARNQQGGSNNAPTVSTALAGGLGLITISGGVMTVKNGDGTTAFTRTVTREELDAIVGLA